MNLESLNLDKNRKIKLYRQLYNGIVNNISSNVIKLNEKLPSIRELSESLKISKNTITKAYDLLENDGYIYSIPKSGYYAKTPDQNIEELKEDKNSDNDIPTVDSIFKEFNGSFDANNILSDTTKETIVLDNVFSQSKETIPLKKSFYEPKKNTPVILESGEVYENKHCKENISSFESDLLESYRTALFNHRERLNASGDPFGDETFRICFSSFLYNYDRIDVNPANVIVGSSLDLLLGNFLYVPFLCLFEEQNLRGQGLLKIAQEVQNPLNKKKVCIQLIKKQSDTIMEIFKRYNFEIKYINRSMLEDTATDPNKIIFTFVSSLDIQDVNPEVSLKVKDSILKWANKSEDHYIIEYDVSLYFNSDNEDHKTFKSCDCNNKVIYLKSISNLLAKGINISSLILPDKFVSIYKNIFKLYSCSVSLIDQVALSDFIIKGKLANYLNSIQDI